MDINRLRFADLLKKERLAAKVLIEALLEIHGKCKYPSDDEKHDCDNCVYCIPHDYCGTCAKLVLEDWLQDLTVK
jgi:hypothetical protein